LIYARLYSKDHYFFSYTINTTIPALRVVRERGSGRKEERLKRVSVIGFPIVSFTEAHHFASSGVVVDFDGLQVFEQVALKLADGVIEVFTGPEEEPDDEGFKDADTDISIGLTGSSAALRDVRYLLFHRVVDSREEVVNDECGVKVLPDTVDGNSRRTHNL